MIEGVVKVQQRLRLLAARPLGTVRVSPITTATLGSTTIAAALVPWEEAWVELTRHAVKPCKTRILVNTVDQRYGQRAKNIGDATAGKGIKQKCR